MSNGATDDRAGDAPEKTSGKHPSHSSHAPAAEGTLQDARLTELGPGRQPCQALRISLGWSTGSLARRKLLAQLLENPRALVRRQLGEGLRMGLLNCLGRSGAKKVAVAFKSLVVGELRLRLFRR